jgi:hypothetical protein
MSLGDMMLFYEFWRGYERIGLFHLVRDVAGFSVDMMVELFFLDEMNCNDMNLQYTEFHGGFYWTLKYRIAKFRYSSVAIIAVSGWYRSTALGCGTWASSW